MQGFAYQLKAHLLRQLSDEDTFADGHEPMPTELACVRVYEDKLYIHKTMRINYTTYDMRRDEDVIHCVRDGVGFSLAKTCVLVHSTTNDTTSHPWTYAIVLGIFHAQVLYETNESRVEFLWVRWLNRDPHQQAGLAARRLERLTLALLDNTDAVSFIDPSTVIHGCHLMPAFHHGFAPVVGFPSIANDTSGNSRYYYVGR